MSAAGAGTNDASTPSLETTRAAILANGIEVFRVKDETIELAQRVRSHLMDAGVSLSFGQEPRLEFTVRAQNSDFPGTGADEMFNKVRSEIGALARERGFSEAEQRCRNVEDPVDPSHVLDVWYELTFAKSTTDLSQLMDDVRWALAVSKCI